MHLSLRQLPLLALLYLWLPSFILSIPISPEKPLSQDTISSSSSSSSTTSSSLGSSQATSATTTTTTTSNNVSPLDASAGKPYNVPKKHAHEAYDLRDLYTQPGQEISTKLVEVVKDARRRKNVEERIELEAYTQAQKTHTTRKTRKKGLQRSGGVEGGGTGKSTRRKAAVAGGGKMKRSMGELITGRDEPRSRKQLWKDQIAWTKVSGVERALGWARTGVTKLLDVLGYWTAMMA